MDFSVEKRGDVSVVVIRESKLTYPILSAFFAGVRTLVEAGVHKLVIDLQYVNYIDSASIGCLMDIHRLLADKGGALRLCSLQTRVATMLSMTGVQRIVDIRADEARAVESFGPQEGNADA